MLCFIALRGVRAHKNMEHSQRRENIIWRDWSRVVELLLQLKKKQQIMQSINVQTQHKHMYSLYIGSLCNVAFYMARFTCIVTSQVFLEIWMRWSIALSSAFYRGKKNLWIPVVFSFKPQSLVALHDHASPLHTACYLDRNIFLKDFFLLFLFMYYWYI